MQQNLWATCSWSLRSCKEKWWNWKLGAEWSTWEEPAAYAKPYFTSHLHQQKTFNSEGNIEGGLPASTANKKEELERRQRVSNISCEHEHSSFWKGYQTRHFSSIAGILLTKEAMQKIFLNCYPPSEESPALQAMSSVLSSWVCFLTIDTAPLVCHYLCAYALPWGKKFRERFTI